MPVVRHRGGGGGHLLRLAVQELPDHGGVPLRGGRSSAGRVGDGGSFELDGQPFTALNGGPEFTFSEAISFQIDCKSQEEVDYYWDGLTAGGEEGPCGWLKDRYGRVVAGRADAP